MRDFRINLIFEGSSEIMRLFIAREAVDHHFKLAFPIVDPESTLKEKLAALGQRDAVLPRRGIRRGGSTRRSSGGYGEFGKLATHLRYVERTTRHLGRVALSRHGALRAEARAPADGAVPRGGHRRRAVRDDGGVLAGIQLTKSGNKNAVELADTFCFDSRQRVEASFATLFSAQDGPRYRVAQRVAAGDYEWLEKLGV